MGYMGFGMQSYIYKRRPRKPFAKRSRIPSFNPLTEKKQIFKLKKHANADKYQVGLGLVVSVLLVAILMINFGFKIKAHTNTQVDLAKAHLIKSDQDAFAFLVESGKDRLNRGNAEGAYAEFKLAYKIYPNNQELDKLLIETLSVICVEANLYCTELNQYLLNDI